MIGGGEGMMFALLVLAVIFKATIEFCLTRWRRRKDAKREDSAV